MNELLSEQFTDLLADSLDSLRMRQFSVNLNDRPVRDAYKSIDYLIDTLCLLEKYLPDRCTVREHQNLESYFFRKILERNAQGDCMINYLTPNNRSL